MGKSFFCWMGMILYTKKKVEMLNKIIKLKKIMILDNFYISKNKKKLKKKIFRILKTIMFLEKHLMIGLKIFVQVQ